MVNINVRKESNKLLFDFYYMKRRCREQTALPDTPTNRKKLEALASRIEAEILLDQFDYARYFPNSPRVQEFEKLKRQRSMATASILTNGSLVSFEAFANTWFAEMNVAWRDSYRRNVRILLYSRIMERFGKMMITEITKSDLLGFRAELASERKKNGDALSPDHINRHLKIIRMILQEAAERYQFVSPATSIKLLKIPKTDIDPFTLDEIKSLIQTIRTDYKDYLTTRFFTGMRPAEIDGLRWRYVDLDKRLISVRETWVSKKVNYTKTDSSQRDIEMSDIVFQALVRQKKQTGHLDYVFCTNAGTPLCQRNFSRRVWYPLLRHLELRRRNPYQSRHTAATLWLAAGESPEWIARQLGHASTEMLFRVYSRYVPNLTRRDGSAMEKLINQTMSLQGV
jgi:integrase